MGANLLSNCGCCSERDKLRKDDLTQTNKSHLQTLNQFNLYSEGNMGIRSLSRNNSFARGMMLGEDMNQSECLNDNILNQLSR